MQEMTESEKLAKELMDKYSYPYDDMDCVEHRFTDWETVAKHVQRLVTEARLNECKRVNLEWDKQHNLEQRIAEFTKQLEDLI